MDHTVFRDICNPSSNYVDSSIWWGTCNSGSLGPYRCLLCFTTTYRLSRRRWTYHSLDRFSLGLSRGAMITCPVTSPSSLWYSAIFSLSLKPVALLLIASNISLGVSSSTSSWTHLVFCLVILQRLHWLFLRLFAS